MGASREGSSVMKSRALIVCQVRVPRGRARVERTPRPTFDRASSGSRSDVPDSSRCSGAVAALRPCKTRRDMSFQLDTKGGLDQVIEREGTPSRTGRGGKLQSGPFLRPIESHATHSCPLPLACGHPASHGLRNGRRDRSGRTGGSATGEERGEGVRPRRRERGEVGRDEEGRRTGDGDKLFKTG